MTDLENECGGSVASSDFSDALKAIGASLMAVGEQLAPQLSDLGSKLVSAAPNSLGNAAFGGANGFSLSVPQNLGFAGSSDDQTDGQSMDADSAEDDQIAKEENKAEKIKGIWAQANEFFAGLSKSRISLEDDSWKGILGAALQGSKKLAAIQKAYAIGQVITDTARAISKAFAEVPWPLNIVAAAKVASTGAAQLSKVKGQFHDGISNVPSTGTYLLEQGERVVDRRLNADLKGFLRSQVAGPVTSTSPIAPATSQTFAPQITIQGNADATTVDQLEQMMREVYAERLDGGFV